MKNNDLLRNQWASLGIAFNYTGSIEFDPETAIINLVSAKEFPEDKKMITIALAWLKEYSTFVHIERMKPMLKKIDQESLAILGALASKCIKFGDFRWRTIEKIVLSMLQNKKSKIGDSEALLKMRGCDDDFFKFGIRVAPILPEDSKKLLSRRHIFKMNSWLRNRLLFGTNTRADVATLRHLKLATTGYAAAKILGCSANSAYRNWNDLEEAGWPS